MKLIDLTKINQLIDGLLDKINEKYTTKAELDSKLKGKANSSHGTHVTYASAAPKANGTAAVGTSAKVAREDHVHPLQTSVSGNAGSATKLATARNITIGNKTNSFNGTAAIEFTAATMGLAKGNNASATTAAKAGWYRVGSTTTTGRGAQIGLFFIKGNVGSNHCQALVTVGTSHGQNPTLQQLAFTRWTSGILTKARIVYLVDSSSTTAYLEVYLNAATATKIEVEVIGDTGWTVVTPSTSGTVPSGYQSKEITFAPDKIVANIQGNVSGSSGSCTGNAATATKATKDSAGQQINTTYIKGLSVSGKTITYTKGDGTTGTITTQDTNTTYTADTGIKLNGTKFQHTNAVKAGTAQGDANKTLSWGGTFTIPTVTYDAQGHITGKGTTTMTMPGNPNTDTHHQAKNIVGASATATANATATNGNVYLNLIENGAVRSKHKIAGTGATTVTSDSSGNITINSTNTTYGAATTSANGLMSSSDKKKLDGIAAGANKYTHPSYTAKSSGLYKITVDATGHVSAATAVAKSDITALGIPSTNTTYSTGNASTAGLTKLYTGTGTATDGTMTQAAIKTALDAKAASSHGNHFLDKSITTNFNTTFRTSTKGSSSSGTYFTVVRTDTANVSYAPQYSSGIAWGKGDTHGYLNVNYSTGQAYIGGGSADKLNWVKQLAFTDSSITGNASTATTLQTARTINGTSFNGSANITTANWGTARTLTIGAAGKSVNGSGNVAWSLDEIGAKTRIKKVIDLSNTTTYPVDKWYPCLAAIPYDGMHDIEVAVQLNSGVKPSWANHNAGFTCNLHVKAIAGGWGTTSADSIVLNHTYSHASENPCSYSQLTNSSNAVLWLRGGGKYFVFTDWNASWSVKTASTEISNQTVAPATSCPSISLMKSTMTANLNGNATTATTLQTARTINGTSFNGSGNITTANWGTARTLTIGNSAKSVNGSGNVAWSLSEIGAATSSSVGTLSSLKTSAKGNLVAAINELFQSANNGKQLIANAIGNSDITSNSTFSAMSDAITDTRNRLYNLMVKGGYDVNSNMNMDSLLNLLELSGISVGEIKQIACGYNYTFILKHDGSLYSCGYNISGQLGLGNNTQKKSFTKVTANINNDVKQVACGSSHTIILKNDGSIWSCGGNGNGQLGLGSKSDKNTFTKVTTNINNDVKQIACGEYHTFIFKNDGSAWCCGLNNYGQLGLNDTTNRSTFTQVNINNVKQIVCGNSHTFILKKDGTIWSCGYNGSGQLGLGNTANKSTFTKVTTNVNNDVKQIACGQNYTFILKNDGSLWSCGYNNYGQLGLGTTNTNYNTFTKVTTNINNDVKQIDCGEYHTVILKNDGSIWSCGRNDKGQLGISGAGNKNTFTQVITNISNDVKLIACGGSHTFILKPNDRVWACGYNYYGQLGLDNSYETGGFTSYTDFTYILRGL